MAGGRFRSQEPRKGAILRGTVTLHCWTQSSPVRNVRRGRREGGGDWVVGRYYGHALLCSPVPRSLWRLASTPAASDSVDSSLRLSLFSALPLMSAISSPAASSRHAAFFPPCDSLQRPERRASLAWIDLKPFCTPHQSLHDTNPRSPTKLQSLLHASLFVGWMVGWLACPLPMK